MGKFFSSIFQKMGRKIGMALTGIIATFLSTYIEDPELAMTVAKSVTTLCMTAIGLQGAADAFGGANYHALREGETSSSKKK